MSECAKDRRIIHPRAALQKVAEERYCVDIIVVFIAVVVMVRSGGSRCCPSKEMSAKDRLGPPLVPSKFAIRGDKHRNPSAAPTLLIPLLLEVEVALVAEVRR